MGEPTELGVTNTEGGDLRGSGRLLMSEARRAKASIIATTGWQQDTSRRLHRRHGWRQSRHPLASEVCPAAPLPPDVQLPAPGRCDQSAFGFLRDARRRSPAGRGAEQSTGRQLPEDAKDVDVPHAVYHKVIVGPEPSGVQHVAAECRGIAVDALLTKLLQSLPRSGIAPGTRDFRLGEGRQTQCVATRAPRRRPRSPRTCRYRSGPRNRRGGSCEVECELSRAQ
jgi:hypothetical protein